MLGHEMPRTRQADIPRMMATDGPPKDSEEPFMQGTSGAPGWAELPPGLDRIDRRITGLMARYGVDLLRIALGIVFLWFGVIKLVPGLSPAESLAARTIDALTFGIVPPHLALPILGVWESLIGLGLLTGIALRATLLLLFVQMLGTLTPLLLFPNETFTVFPFVPTLEGQYIIKNAVLISGAIVVGATVRGGELVPERPIDMGRSPQ